MDSLIDEILEVHEAKRFGLDVSDDEVEKRVRQCRDPHGDRQAEIDADTRQRRGQRGNAEATVEGPICLGQSWCAAATRQASKSATATSKPSCSCTSPTDKPDIGYEYIMRPIVFIVPRGSPDAAFEARKHDADALRARFQNCADGIPFARALARSRGARSGHEIFRRPAAGIARNSRQHRCRSPDAAGADRRRACRCSPSAPKRKPKPIRRKCGKCATRCSSRNSAPRPSAIWTDLRRAAMIEYKYDRHQDYRHRDHRVPDQRKRHRATFGIDARRARRDRARPCACRSGGGAPSSTLPRILYRRRSGFSRAAAPRGSVSTSRSPIATPATAAAAFRDRAAGRATRCRGERRAGPARSVERAGRHRLDPPRGRRRHGRRGRGRRHQSGRQERALQLGLRRTRPYRVSGDAGAGGDRQVAAAGDDAVVAGTRRRAGDDPSAAARTSSRSFRPISSSRPGASSRAIWSQRFGIAHPRLAIAGLNPHAGEEGALGEEDRTIVAPAVARLVAEGIDARGPAAGRLRCFTSARARATTRRCACITIRR